MIFEPEEVVSRPAAMIACDFSRANRRCAPYFRGSTTVLDDPSGAACMPGGLWPCGLSGGAPPEEVSIGPVQPCGCSWPLASGAVVPVGCLTEPLSGWAVCAPAMLAGNARARHSVSALIRTWVLRCLTSWNSQ